MSNTTVAAPNSRSTDPITSDWAGENENAKSEGRAAVYLILTDSTEPMSDWHIFQEYQRRNMGRLTQQRLRTARNELRNDGVLDAAGFAYNASPTNGKAMTWALTNKATS